MMKRIFLAAAIALCAVGAQAATTVATVAKIGGPLITGNGAISSDGNGGFNLFSNNVIGGTISAGLVSALENPTLSSGSFVAFSGVPVLSAFRPLDVVTQGVGSSSAPQTLLSALYLGQDSTLQPLRFLLEITTSGSNNPLTQAFSTPTPAQFTVSEVAPIPLPAGAWLLISAVGGLVVVRRRAAARAA